MKTKKQKLDSLPKIHRRLFKIWSEKVRARSNETCEYCGIKKGEINKNGKATKIDAHHLYSRNIRNCPLKWDINNGISLCPICHKWGDLAFHKSPVTTIEWLRLNKSDRFNYVLQNTNERINLENRKVLEAIESKLIDGSPLEIHKLKEIDQASQSETSDPNA